MGECEAGERVTFRNRIIEYGVKPADQFLANPKNARVHPQFQRDVMKAALDEVGFVAPVIESKSGVLLDGHERVWQGLQNNASIPFVVVDVDSAEEDYVLATFDPITALARYDAEQLDALLADVNSDQPAIQDMLAQLAQQEGGYALPQVGEQKEPSLKSECFIEVYCSHDDLDEFRSLLSQWVNRPSVTINFS